MSNLEPESASITATGLFLAQVGERFNGKLLDVGCGHKPYKEMWSERVSEWVGLDLRPVGEIVGDAHQMPCEDASFDTVLCTNLLHRVPVPSLVLSECVRVLKPGGSLIISAPMTYPADDEVFYTFHPQAIGYLLTAAHMKIDLLMSDGRLLTAEWSALNGYNKWAFPIPVSAGSWVDSMDKRYPSIVGAVATKE